MTLSDFSSDLNALVKRETGMQIKDFKSVGALRFRIEDEYDKAHGYVTRESEPASAERLKLNRINKLYTAFMTEHDALLDAKEIISS